MQLTECFDRRSLLKDEDMIFRLRPEGAAKCALRDFRRSEARPGSQLVRTLVWGGIWEGMGKAECRVWVMISYCIAPHGRLCR